jgi:holo-[acyl-carrier protein] synthase
MQQPEDFASYGGHLRCRYFTACGRNETVIELPLSRIASVESPHSANDYSECVIALPAEIDGRRVRIGCDVVAFEDVQESLAAFGDRFLRKVFTASEINDCQGHNRVHRLAARFAAKEAVIKAFAEPDMPFPMPEIEVTRDGPLPLLRMSGAVAERARDQGWLSTSLSLSHADCHAMAVVLVVCTTARFE